MKNENTDLLKSLTRNSFPEHWSLMDMIDTYETQILEYLLSKLTDND